VSDALPLALNGLIETLQDMKWSIGTEFDVLCVSISPSETPALGAAKKRTYHPAVMDGRGPLKAGIF